MPEGSTNIHRTLRTLGLDQSIHGLGHVTIGEVELLVNRGARFVMFEYCISIVIMTFKNPRVYFLRSGERAISKSFPFILISLLLGWWGIPWGPIHTITSLATNLRGGRDVTAEVMVAIAIKDYDEAVRLNPQDADAYNNRGFAYNNLGQFHLAIEDFDEAVRLNPEVAKAYVNRGIAYTLIGRATEAQRDADQAVSLGFDPGLLKERLEEAKEQRYPYRESLPAAPRALEEH